MKRSMLRVLFECDDYGEDKLFIRPVGIYENDELAERAAAKRFEQRFADKVPRLFFSQMKKSRYGNSIIFQLSLEKDCVYSFHIADYELNQPISFTDGQFDAVSDADFDFDL